METNKHFSGPEKNIGRCFLCKRGAQLLNSHGIPKFIGKRLKNTSATGFLRGINPNRRVEDLETRRMLCCECEQRFSVFERQFQEKVFDRFRREIFKELVYDIWLLKFIVSINWRMLVASADDLIRDYPQFENAINKTLVSWQNFLLDTQSKPGDGEHHLFIYSGLPDKASGEFHPKTLHYIFRGVDGTPVTGDRTLFIYCNCMGYIFISPIIPRYPKGLVRTKVAAGPGVLRAPQEIGMNSFSAFLAGRVEEVFKVQISDKQSKKIADSMLLSPERTLSSESIMVEEASWRLLKHK